MSNLTGILNYPPRLSQTKRTSTQYLACPPKSRPEDSGSGRRRGPRTFQRFNFSTFLKPVLLSPICLTKLKFISKTPPSSRLIGTSEGKARTQYPGPSTYQSPNLHPAHSYTQHYTYACQTKQAFHQYLNSLSYHLLISIIFVLYSQVIYKCNLLRNFQS